MKRHASVIGPHTGLWTMMLSAGTAAAMYQIPGITVDDSGGADFTSIQAAVDAASERAMVEMRGPA